MATVGEARSLGAPRQPSQSPSRRGHQPEDISGSQQGRALDTGVLVGVSVAVARAVGVGVADGCTVGVGVDVGRFVGVMYASWAVFLASWMYHSYLRGE